MIVLYDYICMVIYTYVYDLVVKDNVSNKGIYLVSVLIILYWY